jgi:putative DNA primase/helicase
MSRNQDRIRLAAAFGRVAAPTAPPWTRTDVVITDVDEMAVIGPSTGMTTAAGWPLALHVRFAAIPTSMKQEQRWLVWRFEQRDGRVTKVPYQARRGGRRASSTEPTTWSTFEAARDVFLANTTYNGVGFVLGNGWCGIDLDHCCDGPGATVAGWAAAVVELADSYTEYSISGTGLHIILHGGEMPAGVRQGGIEMYGRGRYFTISGWALPGRTEVRTINSDALEALRDRILPPATVPIAATTRSSVPLSLDDSELLDRARGAANGAKFSRLYDHGDVGGHGDDDSAADMALSNHLLYWTGGDLTRADRLFRSSALMRPKWDEMRGASTYGELTLAKAGVLTAASSQRRPSSASQSSPMSLTTPPANASSNCTSRRTATARPDPHTS